MAQESLSISIGECIATFTNILSGESISFDGSTMYNEDELLGEITMKSDAGERFPAANGLRDVVIQNMSLAGQRDVTFLQGTELDKLVSWSQKRPQPQFDFDFYYKYDTQSVEGARIHRHKRCFFLAPIVPSIARGKGYVTTKIDFGEIKMVNPATGAEI